MNKIYTLFMLALLSVFSLTAQVIVTDDTLQGDTEYNWTNDNVYVLDGYVFLEAGSVLNIEAGTRIEGRANPTNGVDESSALIITRGAQINATGTEENPIVFTAEGEDGSFDALEDRGSWGGLIILGNAEIGEDGGEENIEGIPESDRSTYGAGSNTPANDESSGILKYVSVRYAGAVLAGDNEINGITLGGVGSGTLIDFVEVFGNADDGIEIFGGHVDIKHAVVAFCGDESFDTDESWAGRGQYWFALQAPMDPSGNEQFGGEHDGSEADDLQPKTVHTIYNATFVGMGPNNSDANAAGNIALRLRNDVGISYNNSIFTEFGQKGMRMQSPTTERYLAGDFELNNNIWFGFGDGDAPVDFIRVDGADQTAIINKVLAEGNEVADPLLAGISRTPNGGLDPRPSNGSPALSGAFTPEDDWFDATSFRGAFSFANNWALNWTHLDEQGYFGDLNETETVFVRDVDLQGDTEYNWTADNIYVLDGYVFLEEGGCLNIQAGTRIEATPTPTNGVDESSALIITRGAQIKAEGTADEPIIFTAQGEDGSFDPLEDRGSWGGLIILGNAEIGEDGGEENIEGIPESDRSTYGAGSNTPANDESSGILKYVSIRYGGAVLAGDNEINGLTLGGVGSGTEIDFIEVFGNADDGIEIFGGYVDIKHAGVAFCGDESFDTDESWAGRGQFWFALQATADPSGNEQFGGEHDGSEADDLEPKTVHTIYNATFFGMGPTNADANAAGNIALRLRNDVGISYNNSIIAEFGNKGLRIQSPTTERYLDNDFQLRNNIWSRFGDGDAPTDFIRVDGADQTAIINKIVAEGNDVVPAADFGDIISSISRTPNEMLDPRPNSGSLAFQNIFTPADDWFEDVNYRGAFDNVDNWLVGWSHLDEQGYFGNLVNTFDYGSNEAGLNLNTIAPNPARNSAMLNFNLPQTSDVIVYVFDMNGKVVLVNKLGTLVNGENNYNLDLTRLATGQYVVGLVTTDGGVSQKLTVVK
ncbi:MAG: T9SS type A sorting domain-containing protein [Bacteroidota bacterium]